MNSKSILFLTASVILGTSSLLPTAQASKTGPDEGFKKLGKKGTNISSKKGSEKKKRNSIESDSIENVLREPKPYSELDFVAKLSGKQLEGRHMKIVTTCGIPKVLGTEKLQMLFNAPTEEVKNIKGTTKDGVKKEVELHQIFKKFQPKRISGQWFAYLKEPVNGYLTSIVAIHQDDEFRKQGTDTPGAKKAATLATYFLFNLGENGILTPILNEKKPHKIKINFHEADEDNFHEADEEKSTTTTLKNVKF